MIEFCNDYNSPDLAGKKTCYITNQICTDFLQMADNQKVF